MKTEQKLTITHLQHYLAYGLRVQYEGIINGAELKQWEKEFSDRYEINGICPTRPCPEAIIGDKIGFIKRIEFRKNGSPSFLIGNKVGKRYYDLEGIKPLLLPLSALYEEIDGEIGIVELAKICNPSKEWILGLYEDKESNENWQIATDKNETWMFYYSEHHKSFHFSNYGYSNYIVCNQLVLFDYLFSHHYDVYGLIDKGLAIDKRSVK